MHVFPSFSKEYILSLEWETVLYWYRRAQEIFFTMYPGSIGKMFLIEEAEDNKLDDDSFEKSKAQLYERLRKEKQSKEGSISV